MLLKSGLIDLLQLVSGMYASAAEDAKKNRSLTAKEFLLEALKTASEICIYTNNNISIAGSN